MVITVRTEVVDDGLIVVKEAADEPKARLALQSEVDLLYRAAHPGVVAVVSDDPMSVRLRHGGTSIGRLGPLPPDDAAAIVRAVAGTIADLHAMGIAHCRIDADHVLLGSRGTVRLCGFRGASADEADRAVDVAAMGALLIELLDAAAAAGTTWTGANRGVLDARRRRAGATALRRAARAACRPDAAARPTAKQFGAALAEAVPAMRVPSSAGVADDADRAMPRIGGVPEPRGWDTAELLRLTDEARARSTASVSPIAAPTSPVATSPLSAAVAAPATDAALPLDESSVTKGRAGADPAPSSRRDEPAKRRDGPALRRDGPAMRRLVFAASAAALLVVGLIGGVGAARSMLPFGSGSAADAAAAGSDDDRAIGVDTTSVTTPIPDSSSGQDPASEPVGPPSTPSTPSTRPSCEVPTARGPDLDGDGCAEPVTLDGRIAELGGVQYAIGRDGDAVALADVDCDGIDVPVVYRPSTGEVFVFAGWAVDAATEARTTMVVDGGHAVRRSGTCGAEIVDAEGQIVEVVA